MKSTGSIVCLLAVAACSNTSRRSGTAAATITAPPRISSETEVDTPVPGTTALPAKTPALAFDGTNYLVVWADARNSMVFDLWATRISATGQILDPNGIEISSDAGTQGNPAVAFDGTRYVVAWETASGADTDIAAATVGVDGTVTALPPVASTTAKETHPAFGRSGGTLLLAWTVGGEIDGAIFTGAFGAPFAITSGSNVHDAPAIAGDSAGEFLVAFDETTAATKQDVRAQLVSASSGLVGSAFDIAAGSVQELSPAAAFDGTNFDVVWTGYYPAIDIYGARVTTAGTVLDHHTEGTLTVGGKVISNAPSTQEQPTISCTASGCLVAWQDERMFTTNGYDLYGQWLSTSFALVGGDFAISAAPLNETLPRIAGDATGLLAVWQDQRAGADIAMRIGATRITSQSGVLDATGFVVNTGRNQQLWPAVAHLGISDAVVWTDSRTTWGNDAMMVRVDATGALLDSSARTVSADLYAQVMPAVAPLGNGFLYAWADTRSPPDMLIRVARQTASGTILDPGGVLVSNTTHMNLAPRIASAGSIDLVVWEDGTTDPAPAGDDIWGALVDSSGAITGPFAISTATDDQLRPAVAFDASSGQFVVVWTDLRSGQRTIYGARVTMTGAVLDPGGVAISAPATGESFGARLAALDGTFLVVYDDSRTGDADLYATRVTAGSALTILDSGGFSLGSRPGDQLRPDVATLQGDFLVAWSDSTTVNATDHDIWGQRIATSAQLDGASFRITTSPSDEGAPAITEIGTTNTLLAYVKQLALGTRVMIRRLSYSSCDNDEDGEVDEDRRFDEACSCSGGDD